MVTNLKIKRSYLFFPDKEKKGDGYKPDAKLRLRVRWSARKVDFNVGYRVKLSQWDTQTQRCRAKTTNLQKQSASLINGVIQTFETAIDNVFASFELENILPTPDQVRTKFNLLTGRKSEQEIQSDKTFFDYFDEFTEEEGALNNWSKGTRVKFQNTRNHLTAYSPGLRFEDLTEAGLSNYAIHLREVKYLQNSTIIEQIKLLKWFLRWATVKGYCQTLDYINFKPKLKTTEKKIVFLDWAELMTIYNYPFTDKQKTLERVRDVFCFCCFTSLRYSDVANLKRSDVFDGHISLTTIKTADSIKIELNKYSRAILDKYADQQYPGNRALPVISNQKMNDYLKEMGKICGIDQPITITYYRGNERIDEVYPKYELLGTHTGRRTFICNALMMGIAPQVVMKWTGHSDYKAMQPYIDIADSAKAEAMKLFNK